MLLRGPLSERLTQERSVDPRQSATAAQEGDEGDVSGLLSPAWPELLRNFLVRPFLVGSFAEFWRLWNPFVGYLPLLLPPVAPVRATCDCRAHDVRCLRFHRPRSRDHTHQAETGGLLNAMVRPDGPRRADERSSEDEHIALARGCARAPAHNLPLGLFACGEETACLDTGIVSD